MPTFARGEISDLITKPKIAAHGLNWQHCHSTTCVGLNDSFESLYQLLRRFWRFGQVNTVDAYLIASEREGPVVANLNRKEHDFEAMADAMAFHMRDITRAAIRGGRVAVSDQRAIKSMELPKWLTAA